MLNSVKQAIAAYGLLQDTRQITVAVSGGADSTALLYAMAALREQYGYELYAAHYNHRLRGAESDSDAAFVAQVCQKLGVPLFSGEGDVAALARQQKCSIELAARQARYAFLEQVAKGKLATAHTAEDNLETVLFHIARGTGLRGLCGIPPQRDNIIRPMLFCTRRQVEAYLAALGAAYRTDSTNAQDAYTRNRIRHHIVPQLQAINSSAVEHTAQLCRFLQQDQAYLAHCTEKTFADLECKGGLAATATAELHPAIRIRVIEKLLTQAGVPSDALHLQEVEQLVLQGSGRRGLFGGFSAEIKGGVLRIVSTTVQSLPTVEVTPQNGPVELHGLRFLLLDSAEYEKKQKIHNLLFKYAIDYGKISGKLVLRSRMEGDALKIAGRGVTKTLKKLFCEADIPVAARNSVPVLADAKGVLFVRGFGVDARVQPDVDCQKYLVVIEV